MRKKLNLLILLTWSLTAVIFCRSNSVSMVTGGDIVHEELVPLADPFILLYKDTYYAYGTGAANGIEVMTSVDLKKWRRAANPKERLALHKDDSYGDKWFWAPEVYYVNGKFYMYYSAEEHICVATSDSPTGPFIQQEKKPMLEGEKAIDNSFFIDDDGTPYLFFDRFNDGLNIWVAELEKDLMTIKKETMHPCIHVSQEWEKVWPRVNEGVFVIKHEGIYYMTYSANSYESQFYGIGCATATDIMGEWTKYPHNPLLQKPGKLVGVGHSSMFKDKKGQWKITFHAHQSESAIHPRNMFISSVGFRKVNGVNQLYIDSDYETPLLDLATAFRAPAYPLVTVDPYFNAWSYTDNLYDDQTRHWTGKEFPMLGALRVDGEVYRFMGKEELPLKPVLSTVREERWEGKYTFDKPVGEAWKSLEFNDAPWRTGNAAFGTPNEPHLSTLWETKDIWVRRIFNLDENLSGKTIYLHYSHDDIFELYINGIQVVETGYSWKYNITEKLSEKVKATLRKGKNIITAHCHNRTGGGYVDFGLYEKEENKVSFHRTAEQKSVSLLPTHTVYTFDCGPVELDLIFTTPLLLDDLDLVSRPVSYVTYQVKSKDGAPHDVQVYFEVTPQWAVNDDSQKVGFEKIKKEGKIFLKTGTVEQPVLQKKGDDLRIDWGYFYLTGGEKNNAILNFGGYWDTKEAFQKNGHISGTLPEKLSPNMAREMTVLAYSRDLGEVVSQKKAGFIMLGYDDIYSIQYFQKNLKGYWTHDGTVDILQAFKSAERDYSPVMKRCDDFNRAMMADAERAGGRKYAELTALAYRQAIAAHKLVRDENGTLLFLSKENNSNGSIGTVDITYPSSPLFLVYNPELVKGLLNHIFYYSESGKWTKPFAAHDVGTYPIANGQTYGGDMPVEESGNMLILTAAVAEMEGNADYAARHWEVLTTWTDYLVEKGLDPDSQLCTDDFAGHFAHNANLSVKAVMGVASFGKLASMLGKTDEAEKYLSTAAKMAVEWEKMARDGDHYKLTFDRTGTWSQKYNLVWDRLLGFNIFDPEIARKEMAYYLTQQNEYGLPLDNRASYTKSDWIMWTAVLTGERDDFEALVDLVYKYANETPSRVPVSDWHDTVTAERVNFKARSVVGGYFMKILENKLNTKK